MGKAKKMTDREFKTWFKTTKENTSGIEVRHIYGHLTSEDLWEGASSALEAKNPSTGNWVEIYPITQ